ncbi:MAG: hypothetical protein J0626_12250 [Rhodospirillaceae bacterium]|nr:hypothetical protein [Rhodospirillaceae bacterium]
MATTKIALVEGRAYWGIYGQRSFSKTLILQTLISIAKGRNMSARWIWIIALLGLAACEPRDAAKQQDGAAQEQSNQAATVAALPQGQRDGVFFRAIRDAGLNCQHLISIPPQGPATVTSRAGR